LSNEPCTIVGCGRSRYGRQKVCEAHYRRKHRTGDLDVDRPVGVHIGKPCMVDDCNNIATERGLCHGHYLRLIRLGTVQADRPLGRQVNATCMVDGCHREATNRQLCKTHAGRLRKFGDVQADKPIRTVNGTGYLDGGGYLVIPVPPELRHLTNGAPNTTEHRLVMAQHLGRPLLATESVHHRNGNRTDNRLANLELWSRWQPSGQRIEDKIEWALSVLSQYAPGLLTEDSKRKLE
jgi:HNH endonuclease